MLTWLKSSYSFGPNSLIVSASSFESLTRI